MNSAQDSSAFTAFVPGFDFLQKLAQGGQASMAQWVAPTLDPKALEQRISELKAVQFWLEQNAVALKATLQALEVQKMTLATLQSMGGSMTGSKSAAKPTSAAMPDPMQYWGALTQQFQKIATEAMQDVAARAAAAHASPGGASQAGAAPKAAASAAKSAPRRRKSDGGNETAKG